MKKLLFLLLIALATNTYSQNKSQDNDIYGLYTKKEAVKGLAKSTAEQAGIYLNKSSNYQYGALGCATLASGLFVGYGCLQDKFELNDEGETKMTSKAKGFIIGGSILGIIAIVLEVNAIKYKTKAGNYLRLQTSENGAGLAFVF